MTARTTKTATILKLLKRRQGATIAQLQKPTGWQPHSVRASLTDLRKNGYDITRTQNDAGVSVYRISEDATQ